MAKKQNATRPELALPKALLWKPEMIIMLSDTDKTWSTSMAPEELIRKTRDDWNRARKTKIDTICFDRKGQTDLPAKAWMHKLAEQNGGQCKEIAY
jgi:hypothetical protein